MTKSRLEAFSDGVLAVIITIMVLELKHPDAPTIQGILRVLPSVAIYLLSFLYIGIYWSNHHHMFQASKRVTGAVLWANLHLLFWLSLVPPATGWVAEFGLEPVPLAVYASLQLMAGVAYYFLGLTLVHAHGKDSPIAHALGKDIKGKVSVAVYAVAIGLAWLTPPISCALMACVAIFWLIPDKRMERVHEDRTE